MNRSLIILLAFPCASAFAQESAAYVFAAPGARTGPGSSATVQGGLGGELVWKYLGFGAEASYLAPQQSFSSGVGVFSIDPAVHIPWHGSSRIDPYFLGGYTLLFRAGTFSGANYGGGVNWWFRPNYGLKVEFRDQVIRGIHYFGFRFGVNFHTE